MTTHTPASSWISSISYRNVGGDTYLAIFTHAGPALLYSSIPPHIPGLLVAGTARRSIGLAYNRLVKGQYPYQRVEDPAAVEGLRQMMATVEVAERITP